MAGNRSDHKSSSVLPVTTMANPPRDQKAGMRRCLFWSHISLRCIAIAATLLSALAMATNKQTIALFGLELSAKYTDTTDFKFLVIGNAIACGYSLLSALYVAIFSKKGSSRTFFSLFLLDLVILVVSVAATSAATSVGLVGKYGNKQTGWAAICDSFAKFCTRSSYAIASSYVASALFFVITILSAASL